MNHLLPPSSLDDELRLPMVFVPHGDAPPAEWLARHPDWVKIPAVMVPRKPAHWEAELPASVVSVGFPPVLAPAAPAAAEAIAAAMSMLAALVGAAAAHRALEAYRRGGVATPTEPNTQEALEPPPDDCTLPGFAGPPDAPGQEGFSQLPPMPTLEGLVPPLAPFPHILATPADEQEPFVLDNRNHGLPPGAETYSYRARNAARLENPAALKVLGETGWIAHHLINVASLQDAMDLVTAATRAGWRTDEQENIVLLPNSQKSRQQLRQNNINLPYHNSGHETDWNRDVAALLKDKVRDLAAAGLMARSVEYDKKACALLRALQHTLRQKLAGMQRVTEVSLPARPGVG